MKIVYCLNSIQELGGIASITIAKANALAERMIEVFILVTDHNLGIKTNLSDKVKLINLEIRYYDDDWKSKLHVLKGILIKRRKHKRVLKKVLKKINPDIVISVGQSEKYFLPEIKGNWKTIREFHYDKYYRIRSAKNRKELCLAKLINFYDYNFKIKKYDKIVLLTEADKLNWKYNNKIKVIPNFTDLNPKKEISDLTSNKIIAVGRLEKQKNFISLIQSASRFIKDFKEWKIEIYGEGSQRNYLQKLIDDLKLNDQVILKGKCNNMKDVYKNASILVLTSLFEGFPMTLLEPISFGIPIISYDCPTGPSEIINKNSCGYLIALNDEILLSTKIIELIKNEDKRKKLGRNAFIRSKYFSKNKIIDQWISLFNKLVLL